MADIEIVSWHTWSMHARLKTTHRELLAAIRFGARRLAELLVGSPGVLTQPNMKSSTLAHMAGDPERHAS